MFFHVSQPENACHLLKVSSAEFESSFLKYNIKGESNCLWILIDKIGSCWWGHLGSVGGSDYIPCISLLKDRSHVFFTCDVCGQ